MAGQSDHVERNKGAWDSWAKDFVEPGEKAWASAEPYWGAWQVPESQVGMLPADLNGLDSIELGCGAGYVSAWLKRRGANPVGLDLSMGQLATAERMGRQHPEAAYPLVRGNAEELPFSDETFDFAISEYGASIWCDPYKWIPEASRVLRPGGRLVFLVGGFLSLLATPPDGSAPTETLYADYFGAHRWEWLPDWPSVEFHIGYGDMIRLLRRNGFEVEDLIEIRPSENSEPNREEPDHPSLEWSRRWPGEEVWKASKKGG